MREYTEDELYRLNHFIPQANTYNGRKIPYDKQDQPDFAIGT